ncbi:hypothetical protein NCC49_002190 [Naganishia albida]|nr:hypothetical protein NCC49_002190 [Naganishia albida]
MGDPSMMQNGMPPANAQYYGGEAKDPNLGAGFTAMQPQGQYPPAGQYVYDQGQQPMGYGGNQQATTTQGEQDFS